MKFSVVRLLFLAALLLASGNLGCSSGDAQRRDDDGSDTSKTASAETQPHGEGVGGLGLEGETSDEHARIEPTMEALETAVDEHLHKPPKPCRRHEEAERWLKAAECYRRHFERKQDALEVRAGWYLLKASANYTRAGESAKAQMVRIYFLKHRPGSKYAPTVIVLCGDDFRRHNTPKRAKNYYQLYLEHFPDGYYSDRVRKHCGEIESCAIPGE